MYVAIPAKSTPSALRIHLRRRFHKNPIYISFVILVVAWALAINVVANIFENIFKYFAAFKKNLNQYKKNQRYYFLLSISG